MTDLASLGSTLLTPLGEGATKGALKIVSSQPEACRMQWAHLSARTEKNG